MASDIARETQAMQRRVICGHVFWAGAQAGRLLREGRDFVALNMEKVVEIIERTIRLQLKLTPRSAIFAIRTRVLTFCTLLALRLRLSLSR